MAKTTRSYLDQPSLATPSVPKPMAGNSGNFKFGHSEETTGAFAFFYNVGVRETIESILVAIMLAFIFKLFLAEGFIIPTGSMAPSLMGAHIEITDPESGFTFPVGTSDSGVPSEIYCPITRHKTIPLAKATTIRSGDRIMVNKFIYDFQEPERYDPIVFKYPNNGKQNFIKRLIGLPGENILIENGDVYVMNETSTGVWSKKITRKPSAKLLNTMQVVDDTHHIGKKMMEAGWPLRWQQFSGEKKWTSENVKNTPIYGFDGNGDSGWLRYRNFRPSDNDWTSLEGENLPPRMRKLPLGGLITDTYAYNLEKDRFGQIVNGLHWVGDIGIESEIQIKGNSGKIYFDLVEGGAHFICEIDVASGQATLRCEHPGVRFVSDSGSAVNSPVGQSDLKGEGAYRVLFFNADDRLFLWVNDEPVDFEVAEYQRDDIPLPTYSARDSGDSEPAGFSASGISVQIDRLKIVRDLYYIGVRGRTDIVENRNQFEFFGDPLKWNSPECVREFMASRGKTEPMFRLARGATRDQDQFLPMGDNSPLSSDARIWDGPRYVERDMLIGRAMLVYWPGMVPRPKWARRIPYVPNLKKMRFIR